MWFDMPRSYTSSLDMGAAESVMTWSKLCPLECVGTSTCCVRLTLSSSCNSGIKDWVWFGGLENNQFCHGTAGSCTLQQGTQMRRILVGGEGSVPVHHGVKWPDHHHGQCCGLSHDRCSQGDRLHPRLSRPQVDARSY